jgi:hypothetical protein
MIEEILSKTNCQPVNAIFFDDLDSNIDEINNINVKSIHIKGIFLVILVIFVIFPCNLRSSTISDCTINIK